MGSLVRNPALLWQSIALVCAELAVCVGAFVVAGWQVAAAAGAAGLVACVLFCVFSVMRHREIARLAAEIDEVLHAGRRIDLTDCREGDVAVLRNEVSKMVARLSRTAEQLEREKGALADALADVSHQIRTPLTAIELMIPLIERSESDEERSRWLHELERMVDRVSWLVTALLKMAKLDAGAVRFQQRPVDVPRAVEAAVDPLAVALDMREVACLIEADGSETFEGDSAWTTEAVANIVKNCMEHTPAGGRIAIAVEDDAVACRIRIADTGPGIAEDDLPHIFERFYRGRARVLGAEADPHDDEVLRPQGFGIGLSLAQSLVSAQGGSLRAFNCESGGACFEMTFPKLTV
ncbi:sensor histidine kinase [Raoultibacter phocaeensis]|uniref:sensor histidine kinase n=1 Tax=Raoultibacter phocaeensis TaxID=2479841 RepID=UPI0011190B92|nr:HAMP domain-containing sensor histidine kinase [Raoultibacter phocaeensis]